MKETLTLELGHARPEVREILIRQKLHRWHSIVRCPLLDLKCATTRARRNCLRLMAKYPEIAQELGITVASVYK
jgi:hypothetical protein